MQKFVFKIPKRSKADSKSFKPFTGGELFDGSTVALGVKEAYLGVGFDPCVHGGFPGSPGPVDEEPEALDEVEVTARGAKEGLPTNAESFDGLGKRNVGGVVLESDEVGVVDKRFALTMSRNLIARAVGGETWSEGLKSGEDDQVDHQPD